MLNIFHTSEELEQKKLFEVKEKDYNFRMIESHMFPNKISNDYILKFNFLLKNKDNNYFIKRKHLEDSKIQGDEFGKFRVTFKNPKTNKFVVTSTMDCKSSSA